MDVKKLGFSSLPLIIADKINSKIQIWAPEYKWAGQAQWLKDSTGGCFDLSTPVMSRR